MTDEEMGIAERALRQVRGTVVPVEDPERIKQRRPELVALLEREIRAVPMERALRARRWRRWSAVAAVAAALGLAWGVSSWVAGQTEVTASASTMGAQLRSWSGDVSMGPLGHEETLQASDGNVPEQVALSVTSSLSTKETGHVELELPGEVHVEVNSNTQLQLLDAQVSRKHLRLAQGRVDVRVPKAQQGSAHRVLVTTPDAEVEVRGTVFSVEVRPSRQDASVLITEVTVSRGSVAVRHQGVEHLVSAGSRWTSEPGSGAAVTMTRAPSAEKAPEPSAEEAPEGISEEPSSPALEEPGASEATRSETTGSQTGSSEAGSSDMGGEKKTAAASKRTESTSSAPPVSTLAEQNRLFEQVLQARDRQEWGQVVAHCDRFLAQYPDSALVESVRAERRQALKKQP